MSTRPTFPAPGVSDADCELRAEGYLEQDVNAWTSLGYVAVGLVVAWAVWRRRLPAAFAALAGMVALEGVGSFLFHGRGGDTAQLLHDVPLVGALGFLAGWHVGRLGGGAERSAVTGLAIATVAGAVLGLVAPDATNVTVGVLVAIVVVSALIGRSRRLPPVWSPGLLGLAAIAVVAWLAGTTDSPLCDETSLVQPHGLWHLLTAVLVLAWIDHAAGAASTRPPRLLRGLADRTLALLAAGLAQGFHRSIDVTGRVRIPSDRPVLVVANHGNGFVDPIVVAAVLRRLPRFLGKAALWKVVVARPFLALAGVLPVHRRADGDRSSANQSVFAACHRELALGGTVAIFPEGTTGDRAGLDRVRSGAARIALGAVPQAPDVVIIPIGLAFESRVETRARAAVMIGRPIDVADYATSPVEAGEPDRADVARLTHDIRVALEAVSPEYASVDERDLLRAAARTTHRATAPRRDATFGAVEVLARQLAASSPAHRAAIADAFARYATRLELLGITDRQLGPPASRRRLLASVLAVVLLGSLVLTATLIHLPAIALVVLATGAVTSTATKGTVRLLVGLVATLLTWVIAGVVLADGWAAVAAGAAVALEGALALVVLPPLVRSATTLWGRLRIRDRVGLVGPLCAARDDVVAAVHAAAEPVATVPPAELHDVR